RCRPDAHRAAADARADRGDGVPRRGALQAARQHRSDSSLPKEDDAGLRQTRAEATGRILRGRRCSGVTSLGQRIKALRAERQLQQRQLAEKAGLTPSMLSQIESGRLTPSLHTLGKLAGAFGISIGSLFEAAPNGRLHVSRKTDYPVVSFDGTSEK